MAPSAQPRRLLKAAAIAGGVGLAGLAGATLALKMLLPPEKIKSLIAQEAGKFLGRQIRIKEVSVGLLQGVRIEGVEVSEKPDFKAGTFVSVDAFDLKIQLMPLLAKRVIIDRVLITEPSARVVKNKDGSFNFSDLLAPAPGDQAKPASAKPAKPAAAPLDLPFVLDVKRARVSGGKVVYADPASRMEMTVSGLQASADGFSLEKPFPASFSLSLKGVSGTMKLEGTVSAEARFDLSKMRKAAAGSIPVAVSELKTEVSMTAADPSSGLDAKVSGLRAAIDDARLDKPFDASGSLAFDVRSGTRRAQGRASLKARLDVSRIAEGVASAAVKSVSLEAAGLKADLALKASLDPKQFSLSGVEGDLLGGKLTGLLKVRDYSAAPDIRLEADMTSVDLEKLLAANDATLVEPAGPKAKPAKAQGRKPGGAAGAGAPAEPRSKAAPASPPMSTSGWVKVGEVRHPFASAKDISLDWDLKGITPELDGLAGRAAMKVAAGRFSALDSLAARSKVLRVLTLPFVMLQKIGTLPLINKVLPNFSSVTFSEIVGNYAFDRGVMTLRECRMSSSVAEVTAAGSADLAKQTLAVTVLSQMGKLAPIGIDVTGTFDQPKTRLKASTLVGQPVGKAIEPARKLIEGLFKRRQ